MKIQQGWGTGMASGLAGDPGVPVTQVRARFTCNSSLQPVDLVVGQLQHVGLESTAAQGAEGHVEPHLLSGVGHEPVCRQGIQSHNSVPGK